MRKRIAILALVFVLWDTAASAAVVYLREDDRGVWGATLRACADRVPPGQCANILPLVLDESGIAAEELRQLPEGQEVRVNEDWLSPAFTPSPEVKERARAIFGETSAEEARLQARITTLVGEKADLEKDLAAARKEAEENRLMAAQNQKAVEESEAKLKALEQELAAKPAASLDKIKLGFAVVLGFILAMMLAILSFNWYRGQNVILPKLVEVPDPAGRAQRFRLEDNNTYTCLRCEEAEPNRNFGRGLRLDRLEEHLAQAKIHSDLWIMDATERST